MSKNQVIKRMLAALGSGLAITFLPLFVLIVFKAFRASDHDPSDTTALTIVLWPIAVLGQVLPQNTPLAVTIIAGFILTILVYSSLIYLVMAWRSKAKH
jgi:hypothetical protein